MRKINKGLTPIELTNWANNNPKVNEYEKLDKETRDSIRTACSQEQYYICAYCCKRIDGTSKTTVNEHIIPRAISPNMQLDFNNIVASCNTQGQCDSAHKDKLLPLTPLMNECEDELRFLISGEVEGKTQRAIDTINVLNLGNRKLTETRKQIISTILCDDKGIDPDCIIDDKYLLQVVIDELNTPDLNQELIPYSPIAVNILREHLQTL